MPQIIVLGIVLLIVVVFIGQQRGKKLISEGKIVKRDANFVECAEIFTLSGADFAKIVSALKTIDSKGIGVYLEAKTGSKTVDFKSSHGWTARLAQTEADGERSRYNFSFTGWQTRKGMVWRIDTMNMVLTAVEKAFLSVDPNTQVESKRFKTKTKSSFF